MPIPTRHLEGRWKRFCRSTTSAREARMRRPRRAAKAVFGLAIAAVSAVAARPALAEPLQVVASFSIIADFARNVGGDRVSVTTLVQPGGDVHAYQPRPADAASLARADVVLVNGLGFEGFLERLADAGATGKSAVELSAGVKPIPASEAGHDGAHDASDVHAGEPDAHAFQSAANARLYVENAAKAFCAADPQGCDAYRANAAAYGDRLDALDAEIRETVASIPTDRRAIITSHDAFGYFERAYGLRFMAPQGISTDSEPSARDIAVLIDQIRHESASAIFVENMTDRRLMEQIASETGLQIGGELYSDTLSGADGPAATYIDMMRSNVRTIRAAILGQ
jgi:zinc/manganese transport system substrate-binding protein